MRGAMPAFPAISKLNHAGHAAENMGVAKVATQPYTVDRTHQRNANTQVDGTLVNSRPSPAVVLR